MVKRRLADPAEVSSPSPRSGTVHHATRRHLDPGNRDSMPAPAIEISPDLDPVPDPDPVSDPAPPRRRHRLEPPPPSLAGEMDLLRRARAAVRAGDPRGALEHLEQHARRFPASPLAPEAAAVRIEATCAVGDRQTARSLADQFARQWPDSPLSRRVSRLCGEDP
jgi:TolA-binding protein